MKAIGRDAGPVRLPLTDLTPAEFGELQGLIARVNVGEHRRAANA
jgi:5-dehydro-4-deoxyglucarate dehydratase